MLCNEPADNLNLAFTDLHYCCVAFSILGTKSSYQFNLAIESVVPGKALPDCRTDVDGEWHSRNVALLVNQPCFWAERNDGRSYDDRRRAVTLVVIRRSFVPRRERGGSSALKAKLPDLAPLEQPSLLTLLLSEWLIGQYKCALCYYNLALCPEMG